MSLLVVACGSEDDEPTAQPNNLGGWLNSGGATGAGATVPTPTGGTSPGNGGATGYGGITTGNGGVGSGGDNAGGGPIGNGGFSTGNGGFPSGSGGDTGNGGVNPGGSPGTGGVVDPGGATPVIPPVTAECPAWRSGTISFMGLSGIRIDAGAKAAGPTAPMLIYWHGTGSNSGEFSIMAGAVVNGVKAAGGVLVSFQGTTGGDLYSGTSIFGRGDLNLIDQFVACAVKDHNVDPRKIYTTGCSAGGLFATATAAFRSNYIAAAAPNSGGFVVAAQFQNAWTPALMTIHGSNDNVGVNFATTSATADRAFKGRGGFVINCNTGGGHCSGGPFAPDVWNFFQNHPYGTKPSPWAGGLPTGFNSKCELFTG